MKTLIRWGLAAAFVAITAMPAMAKSAKSWVVCLDQSKDARFSTETEPTMPTATPVFFTGAAPIYPGTTTTSAATKDCSAATIGTSPVGTFFVLGGFVGGLPVSTTANANDAFFVIWHFRIGTGESFEGAFDTLGVVRAVSP